MKIGESLFKTKRGCNSGRRVCGSRGEAKVCLRLVWLYWVMCFLSGRGVFEHRVEFVQQCSWQVCALLFINSRLRFAVEKARGVSSA